MFPTSPMEIDIRDQNVGCVGREPRRKGLWCSTAIRKWGNLQHTPFSETLRGHREASAIPRALHEEVRVEKEPSV